MKSGLKQSLLQGAVVALAGVCLTGCATGLLGGGKSGGPNAVQSVPVGNNLTLPPDLSLPPPGQTSGTYQANAGDGISGDGTYDDASLDAAPVAPIKRAAIPQQGDVYDQYGIAKLKPDGTKKTQAELANELKVIQIKKKKQQNPRYGTVLNIGNIFKDE